MQITEAVIRRFERKVDRRQPGECWPWTGARNPKGYGRIHVGNRFHTASRVAWAIANKTPFPADLQACHTCDNPPCCNPAHIWPGTAAENTADKVAKGREAKGMYIRTGLAAYNAARAAASHCPHGHERTEENTGTKGGHKFCRTCVEAKDRRRSERTRARNAAKYAVFLEAHAALIEIAGNGDGSGRNPQLMVDAAVAALAKIEGLAA